MFLSLDYLNYLLQASVLTAVAARAAGIHRSAAHGAVVDPFVQ